MTNLINQLSRLSRHGVVCLALLISLVLVACDNAKNGQVNTNDLGETQLSFAPPATLRMSGIAADSLRLEIFVDGSPVETIRNDEGLWVGNTFVPSNSSVDVIVNWSEILSANNFLNLARAAKVLTVPANATSAELRFFNNEFDTSMDDDGDGRSNLAERNDGSDPFDISSPGTPVQTSHCRYCDG